MHSRHPLRPAPPVDRVCVTSRFNRVLALVVWALAALIVAGLAVATPDTWLVSVIPAAWVSVLAWVALWQPNICVDNDGVELRNVFQTVAVPWPALIHVDTKYALTLYTPGHSYSAWAAPAPGHMTSVRAARHDAHSAGGTHPHSDGGMRPGDLLGTDSGQAAHVVRRRWAELQGRNAIEVGVAERTPVVVSVHWYTLTAVVLLSAGSLAVALLT
ncbi:PH domain-containing protein [Glaciibacter psychrotolerans]|uniref:Low molecular weight protein antigen 6 PH domain-containing protein n=1 Tax=Glaciibacter psychrotolerans TaxID=670054 RepID=A0A7Z0J6C6_9MICO|nr:PH domain-containing protein [Leifsonia psychrotolerans]NYJ19793.1 hypothetical protein [Leifsonia psychrotolerans]